MKIMAITLTFLLSFQAFSKDIFFDKNGKQFVLTTDNGDSVYYAACKVTNNSSALCTGIAEINKEQFKEMRKCETAKVVTDSVLVVTAVVGGGVAGIASSGTLTFAAIVVGGLALDGLNNARNKRDVFSEENEKDIDSIGYHNTYKSFVEALEDSLDESWYNCDVSGEFQKVSKTPYFQKLTAEQKKLLSIAKAH
jgi:uncharacterized FAD-dependent dehydrogenase